MSKRGIGSLRDDNIDYDDDDDEKVYSEKKRILDDMINDKIVKSDSDDQFFNYIDETFTDVDSEECKVKKIIEKLKLYFPLRANSLKLLYTKITGYGIDVMTETVLNNLIENLQGPRVCSFDNANYIRYKYYINILNYDQRVALDSLLRRLEKDDACMVLINSDPGVGKTFMMEIFMKIYKVPSIYTAITRVLVNKFNGDNCLTICKFIMLVLKLNFHSVTELFNMENDMLNSLYRIFTLTVNLKQNFKYKTIIVDECSAINVLQLAFFTFLNYYHNINIIFTGDNKQIHLTDSSIIKLIEPHTFRITMNQQMRMDEEYGDVLDNVKKLVDYDNNVPMNFRYLFEIFKTEMFTNKFLTQIKYTDVVYLSYFHKNITRRIKLIETAHEYNSGKSEKAAKYKRQPYYVLNDTKQGYTPLEISDEHKNDKFLRYLPLFEKMKYEYIHENGARDVMVLDKICNNYCILTPVEGKEPKIMRFNDDLMKVQRCVVTKQYQFLENVYKTRNLYQIPLRPYFAMTILSSQGSTMVDDQLEIDMDTMNFNTIYVALSRVKNEKSIYRIQTGLLPDLIYTKVKGDDCYYKFKSDIRSKLHKHIVEFFKRGAYDGILKLAENVKFHSVSPEEFEHNDYNMKVGKMEHDKNPKSVKTEKTIERMLTLMYEDNKMYPTDMELTEFLDLILE